MSETKQFEPPRTKPLVAIAEVERPVMVVTKTATRTIAHDSAGKRKKEIFYIDFLSLVVLNICLILTEGPLVFNKFTNASLAHNP